MDANKNNDYLAHYSQVIVVFINHLILGAFLFLIGGSPAAFPIRRCWNTILARFRGVNNR
jgi:hypothetical protein